MQGTRPKFVYYVAGLLKRTVLYFSTFPLILWSSANKTNKFCDFVQIYSLIRYIMFSRCQLISLTFPYLEQQCSRSPTGDEYLGNLSTVGGSDCLPWSSYSVLANPYYPLDENYCRNPMEFDGVHRKDKLPQPWCYTSLNGILKQSTCDVRYCGKSSRN